MRTLRSLYRYPVKGLSPESLACVTLRAGCGFPRDRELAITNGGWEYDSATYQPRPKSDFLMLMQHESLAALRSRVSDDGRHLTVSTADGRELKIALDDAADLEHLSDFFSAYLAGRLKGRPRLVRAGSHRFTDVSVVSPTLMQSVSLINLASVRDLSARMGRELNPLRFRANLYYEGGEPWEELSWLDREIRLGALRARVVLRTRRCAATNVDPETGVRDLGVPQALLKNFRHGDMGVYVELLEGGTLHSGDALQDPIRTT
jgi:uncharacterized protein YcbX